MTAHHLTTQGGRKSGWNLVSFTAGFYLSVWAAFLVLPTLLLLSPISASAASSGIVCFKPEECHTEMLGVSQCQSPEGCCVKNRCYEPDQSCSGGAAGRCFARSDKPISLTIKLGQTTTVLDLADYINKVYNYALSLAAMLAAVMMMIGGFQWLSAGGDMGKVSKAKGRITNAVLGLFLVFTAFIILRTINPDLVNLRMPKIPVVKKEAFADCFPYRLCAPCGGSFQLLAPESGTVEKAGICDKYTIPIGQAVPSGLKKVADCPGMSCSKSAKNAGKSSELQNMCSDVMSVCRNPKNDQERQELLKKYASDQGCGEDKEKQINDSGYGCFGCKMVGASCAPSGKSDQCCSQFCSSDGVCSIPSVGTSCKTDKDCASDICQTNWGNICSMGLVGSPCADKGECTVGYCQTVGDNTCSAGTKYSWCEDDAQCASSRCARIQIVGLGKNSSTSGICLDSSADSVKTCSNNSDCPSNAPKCTNPGTAYSRICTDGSPGAPCSANGECASDYCFEKSHTCTDGLVGQPCDKDDDCQMNKCAGGICVTGEAGSRCLGDINCNDGLECREAEHEFQNAVKVCTEKAS